MWTHGTGTMQGDQLSSMGFDFLQYSPHNNIFSVKFSREVKNFETKTSLYLFDILLYFVLKFSYKNLRLSF